MVTRNIRQFVPSVQCVDLRFLSSPESSPKATPPPTALERKQTPPWTSDRVQKFTKSPASKTVSSPVPAHQRNHAARPDSAGAKLKELAQGSLEGPGPSALGRPSRASTPGVSPVTLRQIHKLDSRSSSLPLLVVKDENENDTDQLKRNGDSGVSYTDDPSKWVDVGLGSQAGRGGQAAGSHGLSVLPVTTRSENTGPSPPEPTLEGEEDFEKTQALQKAKLMSLLKTEVDMLAEDSDPVSQQLSSKLEGMRDANDGQDDVFIVELEKSEAGIGLGLIDGLVSSLFSVRVASQNAKLNSWRHSSHVSTE